MSAKPNYAQSLMRAQAEEIVKRATSAVLDRVMVADWTWGTAASRLAVAEALSCLLEDAVFYGEDAVSVRRLKRLRDQLNPADTRGEVADT